MRTLLYCSAVAAAVWSGCANVAAPLNPDANADANTKADTAAATEAPSTTPDSPARGDTGADADAAAKPALPAPATPRTDREHDEQRLAELYPVVLELARASKDVETLRQKAAELVELLKRLTGRTKDDPKYEIMAKAIIREAAKKFNPELYQQILDAEKHEAAAARRSEIGLTYYQMIQIRGALKQYSNQEGSLPDKLSDLQLVGLDLAHTRDAWGRPMLYERRDPGFALGSLGPDGKRDTKDDLDGANAAKALGIDKPR